MEAAGAAVRVRSPRRATVGDVNEESREIPWMLDEGFQSHAVRRRALILRRDRSILEERRTFSSTHVFHQCSLTARLGDHCIISFT